MFTFFHRLLALTLIIAISSSSSFAAVAVSDGSAFVSKAEFAANLNNLNSRMSNLENSLDAKIDSLVSSYLSRNGIWNGEAQSFTGGNAYHTDASYTVVNSFTKSGMLVLPYKFSIVSSIGIYHVSAPDRTTDSINRAYASPIFYYIDILFTLTSNNTEMARVANVYGLTGEYDNMNQSKYRANLSTYPGANLIFFVSKGANLKVTFSTTTKVSMDWWSMSTTLSSSSGSLSGTALTSSDGQRLGIASWITGSNYAYRWQLSSPAYIY